MIICSITLLALTGFVSQTESTDLSKMSKELKVLVSSNDYPESGLKILREHFTVLQSRYIHFGQEGITENKDELLRLAPGISALVWVSHHPITKELLDQAGMSMEEYRAGVRSMNCQSEPRQYPVQVDPSPAPLPPTSSAMVGRRAQCPLERYGRLVQTARDYPTRPPLPPGQIYDPYKQTIIFLGIDVGDPISYKLPAARCEVTDEMWACPRTVRVHPLSDTLAKL